MRDSSKDALLCKFLLENEFVSKEEIENGLDLREQARDFGGSVTLLEILYHQNALTQSELQQLQSDIPKSFPKLTGKLPPSVILDVENVSNIAEKALEHDLIVPRHKMVCEKLQKQYRALGIERSMGQLMVEMRLIDEQNLPTISEVGTGKSKTVQTPKTDRPSTPELDLTPNKSDGTISPSSGDSAGWNKKALPLITFAFLSIVGMLIFLWTMRYPDRSPQTNEQQVDPTATGTNTSSPPTSQQKNDATNKNAPTGNQQSNTTSSSENQSPSRYLTTEYALPTTMAHPLQIKSTLYPLFSRWTISQTTISTRSSGQHEIRFGPFPRSESSPHFPPGIYRVKHQFTSPSTYLPKRIRYAAETHLSSLNNLRILDTTSWYYSSLIQYGDKQEIHDQYRQWIQKLANLLGKIDQVYRNLQTKQLPDQPPSSSNQREKHIRKIILPVQQLRKHVLKSLNTLNDRYEIKPFAEEQKQLRSLSRHLYLLSLSRATDVFSTSSRSSPAMLEKAINQVNGHQIMNQPTEKIRASLNKQHEILKQKLQQYRSRDFVQQQISMILKREIQYSLKILPLIQLFRDRPALRKKVFIKQGTFQQKHFVQFFHFIHSFLQLRKALFSAVTVSKNHKMAKTFQTHHRLLFELTTKVLKKIWDSIPTETSSSFQQLFGELDDDRDINTLRKKLEELQQKLEIR